MEELQKRKSVRLTDADYNAGVFFLTLCTKNRRCMLASVENAQSSQEPVGTGVLDGPQVKLTHYGRTAEQYIRQISEFYKHLSVEHYVIMPNHIHLILSVEASENGPSRTPVPTMQNSAVSQFVSTLKRFCNRAYGENIWQSRSYDHIIRNREDYEEHVRYIAENPMRWYFDELYAET